MSNCLIFDLKSNCSNALNNYKQYLNYIPINRFHLNLSLTSSSSSSSSSSLVSLIAINIGIGTTGTKSLNEIICQHFKLKTIHYEKECNSNNMNSFIQQWIIDLVLCTSKKCLSSFIINRYSTILQLLLTKYQFISDFPIGEILPDLLYFAPKLLIFSTLRDPIIWAKRRLQQHPITPICHPSLWNHSLVNHPFDIMSCLHLKYFTNEALVPISTLSNNPILLSQAFIEYNTFNFALVSTLSLAYYPLCYWDSNISFDNGKSFISNIWNHHHYHQLHSSSTSSSFLITAIKNENNNQDNQNSIPRAIPKNTIWHLKQKFKRNTEEMLKYTSTIKSSSTTTIQASNVQVFNNLNKFYLLNFTNTQSLANLNNLKVIILVPQLSDYKLFLSIICNENFSSKSSLCLDSIDNNSFQQFKIYLNQKFIGLSQKWYNKLILCYYNTNNITTTNNYENDFCEISTILSSYELNFQSIFNNFSHEHLVIPLSIVDYFPYLLSILTRLNQSRNNNVNNNVNNKNSKYLLISLYYPPNLLVYHLSRNKNLFVCHPSLWENNQFTIIHPFDILSCLETNLSIKSSLIPIQSLTTNQIMIMINKYYEYYNSLISYYSSKNYLESFPINLLILSQNINMTTNIMFQTNKRFKFYSNLFNFSQNQINHCNKFFHSTLLLTHEKLNLFSHSYNNSNHNYNSINGTIILVERRLQHLNGNIILINQQDKISCIYSILLIMLLLFLSRFVNFFRLGLVRLKK